MNAVIAPSILSADFARLGEEADSVLEAGADWIHFDVMDNHFVPNLTIGPLVCKALRVHGVKAPVDVHLMVRPVDRLIGEFVESGASSITFHPEASDHIDRTIRLIRDSGCSPGLAISPATSLSWLDHVMEEIDIVLLMSVNPGFGGQKFIPYVLEKIRQAKNLVSRQSRAIRIEVDGGITIDNIGEVAAAGADTFVAGSAVFGSTDYAATIQALRSEIDGSHWH